MYLAQRRILFDADQSDVSTGVDLVPGVENVVLYTPDGLQLNAWWKVPAGAHVPVYLYFPGNSESLLTRDERLAALTAEGAGLLALSWRGYGGSQGQPSEAGLLSDARAAFDWLLERVDQKQIILYGESLGTGIAVQLATELSVAGLILDSPYTSIVDIGRLRYPWLPVRLLSRDHFDSMEYAPAVTAPVFVYHCTEDRIVPYVQGQQLFERLGSTDKTFRSVAGRCHVPSIERLLPDLKAFEQQLGFFSEI